MTLSTKVAIAAVLVVYSLAFVLTVVLWGEAGAGGMTLALVAESAGRRIVKWHKDQIRKGL